MELEVLLGLGATPQLFALVKLEAEIKHDYNLPAVNKEAAIQPQVLQQESRCSDSSGQGAYLPSGIRAFPPYESMTY